MLAEEMRRKALAVIETFQYQYKDGSFHLLCAGPARVLEAQQYAAVAMAMEELSRAMDKALRQVEEADE